MPHPAASASERADGASADGEPAADGRVAGGDAPVERALHRLLVDSVQDYAIFAITTDGRVASWNAGAERLKGWTAADIIGRPLALFYPPEARARDGSAPRVRQLLDEAARVGRVEDEGWRVRRDGSRFWADVVITPVRDASGTLLGFAKVTRDLTARRAAEEHARQLAAAEAARVVADEAQARYRRLFEGSPLPSWTVDVTTGRVMEVNEAAVRRYGYSREEFRTLTLTDLRHPTSPGDLAAHLAELEATGTFHGLVRHRTKSGEPLDVELDVRRIAEDGGVSLVAVATDVTERLRDATRQRFLAEASALLGESLDYDATLARIVRMAVPALADWAAYNVPDGEYIRTVAIHHPDPAMERLADEINADYPMRADAAGGVARVIATGVSELVPDIPDELLRAVAYDEAHHAKLRQIGFRSMVQVPVAARDRVLGALSLANGASGRRFAAEDLAFLEELGRRAGLALDNALHFREQQAARAQAERSVARLDRLQQLAAGVSRALDVATVCRLVVQQVQAALEADAVYLVRRAPEPDTLEMLYGEGFPDGVGSTHARFPLAAPVPGAEVVRTGAPLWLASPAERAQRFGHLGDTPIAQAFGASATLPLQVEGRTVGALGVYFRTPQPFGVEDRAFLGALAEQVALALERARLFEAERRARDIAERLQSVTAALSEAVTPAQVTEIVIGQGLASVGAGAGFVATLTADGAALEIVQAVGYEPAVLDAFGRLPLDLPMLVTDAARTRRPVWAASRAEAAARYAAFADATVDAGRESWAALPLVANGVTLGAIGLSFDRAREIPPDERDFMQVLAHQCAQALERARLHADEARARAAATAAQARAEFLAEASRLLASSLDYRATLDALARAAVPRLGDWCAVDMRRDLAGEPGAPPWPPTVQRLAVMHQDPEKLAWARDLERRQPTDWTAATGLPRVLREGVTEFYPVITDELLVASARTPEELALLREIGFTAYCCVPLRARGRVMGAITLCMTESGRHYDEADRLLAEELGHRASLAVEHAELYDEAQQANRAKTQFLATMSHELRTPLNAIGGYVDLLEMELRGPVTGEQRDDLRRVRRSQQHLLTLINDVLEFARLEAGQTPFRTGDVPIRDVVDGAVPLITTQAVARGHTLDVRACDPGLTVRADAERVRQVIVNLLSNAIKFTPPGGHIGVRCMREGPFVAVSVTDTGIGIPGDRLAAVFEPFVQVESGLTRTAEGTGLGLAISRDLARGMGGELTVESTVGRGSTVTLRLRPGAPSGGESAARPATD